MKRLLLASACLLWAFDASAQQNVRGVPTDGVAVNHSLTITTGNTYQTVVASAITSTNTPSAAQSQRRSITIQNNNTNTDNCFVEDTGLVAAANTTSTNVTTTDANTITSAQASILLAPGGSYQRYWPLIPNSAIVATCAGNGDSLFITVQ